MKESELLLEIRKLSVGDTRLFRNNVGLAQDARGNFTTYGLCVGSADLIGWRSWVVRPRDVGTEIAVFTAIECKGTHGILSKEQRAFLQAVQKAGGFAGVAYEVVDARLILRLDD